MLVVDDAVRQLVHHGANDGDIRRAAERAGLLPMRSDGMRWVTAGVTSQEEVLRVTRD
jgi:general secretion pathway protein E